MADEQNHAPRRRAARSRTLRVIVLMHEELVPPESLKGHPDKAVAEWKTEFDVSTAIHDLGHDVMKVGLRDDLGVLLKALDEHKPHVSFNLLEEFHDVALYSAYVLSYLELKRCPYTGCNPRGLMLAADKGLAKKVLAFHRIPAPLFTVMPIGRRVRRPRRLEFPLIVKSLQEEASLGIAQASVVWSDDKLVQRVAFIHEQIGTDALVEQYIEGRELYLGVIGNQRLTTFPLWEMFFENLPEGAPRIATRKVKWDEGYQKRIGLTTGPATDIAPELARQIERLCKRAYRLLGLSGYARFDLRLTADGRVFVIEANPNPQLAFGEDFAESADFAGVKYTQLIGKILSLGLSFRPMWRETGG